MSMSTNEAEGPVTRAVLIAFASIVGRPRAALELVGLQVGSRGEGMERFSGGTVQQQLEASMWLSGGIALLIAVMYIAFACCCCRPRKTQGQRRKGEEQQLWTVHNKRYDLTGFVARHPGGVQAIELGRGRNCTTLFESYHSLADERRVRAALARHFVEEVPQGAPDYDDRFDWTDTPVYDDLKARFRAHFSSASTGKGRRSHRASPWQALQLGTAVVAAAAALIGFMRADLLSMFLLPFCYWWGPSPCMHDGGHFSLSRSPAINRLLSHLGAAHMSMFSWSHQHTIGHHSDTNIPGRDPDLYHFVTGMLTMGYPGFRGSVDLRPLPKRSRVWWLQCFPRWFVWRCGLLMRMPFASFGPSLLWDVESLLAPHFAYAFLGLVPYSPLSAASLAAHSLGRTLVLWLAFVHPTVVCLVVADSWAEGAITAIAFAVVPYSIHGTLFYIFSQVSHIQPSCFVSNGVLDQSGHMPSEGARLAYHYTHDADRDAGDTHPARNESEGEPLLSLGKESARPVIATAPPSPSPARVEWAVHQVEHAVDYAVDSSLWLHLSNGLNLQVVHHLFPQVGWGHYTSLAPIVADVCAAHGVSYTTQPSFWAALRSHLSHLARVNAGADASVWVQPAPGVASQATLSALGQLDNMKTIADLATVVCREHEDQGS